jgi:two-component sensor histidine kinase
MNKLKPYCLLLFFSLFAMQSSSAQHNKIDSLLNLIKTDKEDTVKVKHYLGLYFQYLPLEDYDSALVYLNKGLALAKTVIIDNKIGWRKGMGHCYNNIGVINLKKGNYPAALKNYFEAKKQFEACLYRPGLALVNNNIGLIYDEQGKYADALKYYFASLKIAEQMNNKYHMVLCCNNLGNAYHWLDNDSAALRYLNTALKLATELDLKENTSLAYNNIGLIYDGKGKYTEALKNYFASLKIARESKNKETEALASNNIGLVYYHQQLYPEALMMQFSSLKLKEEIGDKKGMVSSFINLGDLYTTTHKIKEAQLYLDKALQLAIAMGRKGDILKAYKSFMDLDSVKGNYKDAYKHRLLFDLYHDSIYNEETTNKSLQAGMQYEFDKKEAATKFKNDKAVLELESQNKLSKQKQLFLVIFIVIFVVLTLVVLFFAKRAYDNKKKYSEILSKENEQKEILLQEVHHRVNNSLQMISSLLSIQADNATSEVQEYLLKTEHRIHALSEMHQLLYETNTKLEVDIEKYLFRVLDFYKQLLEANTQIKLNVEILSVKFHSKIALPLGLIVNELVTNAIKYAFPGRSGIINITLRKDEIRSACWKLVVSDNGVGINEELQPIKESSLGLELVRIMTRQINGEMKVTNDRGVLYEITYSVN